MRFCHFEQLHPVCPRCRLQSKQDSQLRIGEVVRGTDEFMDEGVLHCSNEACFFEYPVIDGIPYLLPDLRAYISDHSPHLMARDDLSPLVESLIGDGLGPGTVYDSTRQHLSTYTWDHYADLDPLEPTDTSPSPGTLLRCLHQGLEMLGDTAPGSIGGPTLDAGCSVGRTTFAMAEASDGLVLGVDINVSMLRLAQRVLRTGEVRYPRRRTGIVYDDRRFQVNLAHYERIDFWACDALAMPFADQTFGTTVAMNVLDCMASPIAFLQQLRNVLVSGGKLILATPYDWSAGVTPVEAWIGGHSQRGNGAGRCDEMLRALLTPGAHPQSIQGMRLTGERADVPWHARMHDRSTVVYRLHLVTAEASHSVDSQSEKQVDE